MSKTHSQNTPEKNKLPSEIVRVSVNMPRALLAEVQAAATRQAVGFQTWVVQACEDKLARCKSAVD